MIRSDKTIRKSFKKDIRGGADFQKQVPYAYILPKGKKLYTSARPILGYSSTPFSKLFQVLGRILTDLLKAAYPETIGHRTINECFEDLHKYFKNLPDGLPILDFNDDLKGFFTSVDHPSIREAIKHALYKYLEKHPPQGDTEVFITVDLNAPTAVRTIRGRSFDKVSKRYAIRLWDIPRIVDLALDSNCFTCLGRVFLQVRGASIGAQASPAICATVTAYRESVWAHAYKVNLSEAGFFLRYVDNRLVFTLPGKAQEPAFVRFLSLLFYRSPIELESCGNQIILGCKYDTVNRTCLYVPPEHAYQYRSILTAGTPSRALSGFRARLHLLYRYTYPRSKAIGIAQILMNGYINKGFSKPSLQKIHKQVHFKFRAGISSHNHNAKHGITAN